MTFGRQGSYITVMIHVLPTLLALALGTTVLALVVGIITFAGGGSFYRKHANHIMQARVILQGLTLILFALYALIANS